MDFISKSPKQTEALAKKFLNKNPEFRVIGLIGDLGSGKTAFVKGIAKALEIKRNITSPTFVIEKIYPYNNQKLVHIDAYRLSSNQDLEAIGFDELTNDPKNIIFIEWPERVFNEIPKNIKVISFKYIDENSRKISF